MTKKTIPPFTRRTLLLTGASAFVGLGTAILQARAAGPAAAASAGTVLPLVAELPAGEPTRTAFAEDEQVLAEYLMIVAPMANDIIDDDDDLYGWMDGGWWRTPSEPYNARVMEQVATLSWFYANDRTWNPYYLDANLLGRLEAAIGYYLRLQNADGSFPQAAAGEHNMPTTGFGMVALAETWHSLDQTDALPTVRTAIEDALTLAATWFLDPDNELSWMTPVQYSNQQIGGLTGAAMVAEITGDSTISAQLDDRIEFVAEHGQAPAGYFHENVGFDGGYNFEVMLPDLALLYQQSGNSTLLDMATKWVEFFDRVAVWEPDLSGALVYGGASARSTMNLLRRVYTDNADRSILSNLLVNDVPGLAAFRASVLEKAAVRGTWTTASTPVAGRPKQDTSPRTWINVIRGAEGPTSSAREASIAAKPYFGADFTELRLGSGTDQYLFTRRHDYYAAGIFGTRPSWMVRSGPGLIWHPDAGMVVLSLNIGEDSSWTTVLPDGTRDGHTNMPAHYFDGADTTGPELGPTEVTGTASDLTVSHSGAGGLVSSTLTLGQSIKRTVSTDSTAVERIPLVLQPADTLTYTTGALATYGVTTTATATGLTLTRGTTTVTFDWDSALEASLESTNITFHDDGPRRLHLLKIAHDGSYTVTISFATAPDPDPDPDPTSTSEPTVSPTGNPDPSGSQSVTGDSDSSTNQPASPSDRGSTSSAGGGSAALANTGVGSMGPAIGGAVALLGTGIGVTLASRRRSALATGQEPDRS